MDLPRFGDLATIRFEPRGRVGLLTLHRPERLNAISARMMNEVEAVLDAVAEDDGIGVVVVCGAGRAFCSGYDLKDDAAIPAADAAAWRARLERDLDFLLRFWNHPKPTVAAVHGYCLAGGLELAMSCDITLAEEGCLFGEPELKFGSVIVNMMMPWLVGPKLTKELLLSGDDTLSAERAERIGLVNRVVAKGTHVEEALALAATHRVAGRRRGRADQGRDQPRLRDHGAARSAAGRTGRRGGDRVDGDAVARGVQATGPRAGPEGGACLARCSVRGTSRCRVTDSRPAQRGTPAPAGSTAPATRERRGYARTSTGSGRHRGAGDRR